MEKSANVELRTRLSRSGGKLWAAAAESSMMLSLRLSFLGLEFFLKKIPTNQKQIFGMAFTGLCLPILQVNFFLIPHSHQVPQPVHNASAGLAHLQRHPVGLVAVLLMVRQMNCSASASTNLLPQPNAIAMSIAMSNAMSLCLLLLLVLLVAAHQGERVLHRVQKVELRAGLVAGNLLPNAHRVVLAPGEQRVMDQATGHGQMAAGAAPFEPAHRGRVPDVDEGEGVGVCVNGVWMDGDGNEKIFFCINFNLKSLVLNKITVYGIQIPN